MTAPALRTVVDTWADQYTELGRRRLGRARADLREPRRDDGRQQPAPARPDLGHPAVPTEPAQGGSPGNGRTDGCLLCDYLAVELADGERIVVRQRGVRRAGAVLGRLAVRDAGAAARPPRRAAGPRRHRPRRAGRHAAAASPAATTGSSPSSFPYSMGFHQRPTDGAAHPELAPARALLSAAAALGDDPQVHGRLSSCSASRSATSPRRPRRSGCATPERAGFRRAWAPRASRRRPGAG